jgi:arylsulfatase A-like enzyme
VLYADDAVGNFLDWLDRKGLLDGALVIVSADHGESFEHHMYLHGGPNLYSGLIHIPLLIHLPGQRQGEHISQSAQQADLLPTVLDLIGTPVPNWTDGTSLKPLLERKPLPERYLFSMNLEPDGTFGSISKGTIAVVDHEFKFVTYLRSKREELYRYRTDPLEEHDLLQSEPDAAARLRDVLRTNLDQANQRFAARMAASQSLR